MTRLREVPNFRELESRDLTTAYAKRAHIEQVGWCKTYPRVEKDRIISAVSWYAMETEASRLQGSEPFPQDHGVTAGASP
jgi:hypothetical protein